MPDEGWGGEGLDGEEEVIVVNTNEFRILAW